MDILERQMKEHKKPFVLGLISARGGSIRLPRKNIKMFCGHPLVAWSIIQARCARLIDEVVLTTDDDEIAEVGRQYGAKIIRRPVLDNDTTVGVPFHMAVKELEEEGYKIDEIMCLLPTSPLKKIDDIDNIIQAFHLVNRFKDIKETDMSVYSPSRECFIYKNQDDMTTNYGKPYYMNLAIADKKWNYSTLGGGWNIADKDFLMNTWLVNGPSDSVIDNSLEEVMLGEKKPILGYAIEPWQCFETDYDCYFKICEVLMDEFILKGQGMNVYTRYAREFRKIVEWEDSTGQLPLDFGKYIGNAFQIDKE